MSYARDLQIVAIIIILTILFVLILPLNNSPIRTLSVFTLAMCQIAHFRRSKLSEDERFEVPSSCMYPSLKNEIFSSKKGVDRIFTIILVLSILSSIITLIYVIVTPKQDEKFTEFYILGDNGKAQGYPIRMDAGNNSSVIVGIINHEYMLTNYTLDISLENSSLKNAGPTYG